jgi:hypothetical protein
LDALKEKRREDELTIFIALKVKIVKGKKRKKKKTKKKYFFFLDSWA